MLMAICLLIALRSRKNEKGNKKFVVAAFIGLVTSLLIVFMYVTLM